MLVSMITQSDWSVVILFIFVEGAHGFTSVSVYFYRAIVYLGESLEFDVIAPDTVLPLPVDVLVEIVFSSHNELHKELLLVLNVI